MGRRWLGLLAGLVLFGSGIWLGLRSGLGVGPWDVLCGGLVGLTGLAFGSLTIIIGVVVLSVAVGLGVRPGAGTVANVVVIGEVENFLLARPWLRELDRGPLAGRVGACLLGIALVAVGSAFYIGAHLGTGPRDSLMVALTRRTGWPVGRARAVVEVGVLGVGVALGGPVGVGSALFALGIGPAVAVAFRVTGRTVEPLPR